MIAGPNNKRARRDAIVLFFAMTALISALPVCGNVSNQKPPAPKSTVALRVAVNDRVVKEGESVPLKAGQFARLTVQVVRKDGSTFDVTNNPKTLFVSLTPWTLTVSNDGVVNASGQQGYAGTMTETMTEYDVAVVGVRHGIPGDTEIGGASVLFEISPSSESANAVGLHIKPPKTTLRVGETMQLIVIEKLPDGTTRDVTSPGTGTTYDTTSESMLVPEPDGKVTCIGTHGESWEVATIAAQNGKVRRKVRLRLLAAEAPWRGLEVVAPKTMLREGENVQLHVFKSLSDGNPKDLTAASTGTRYLMFSGYGVIDNSVISINEAGLASATNSIGNYNKRTVIVFVRNGDSVGWVELKVTHASGK